MVARSERPAGRRAVAALLATLVVALVAACRQLVGINDRNLTTAVDAGPPGTCGLALPEGDCRTCVEASCCAAASACAEAPACAQNEACVDACGPDEECVGRCQVVHPTGTVPSVPALDTCIAQQCAGPCQLSCGTHAGLAASPDASVPCEACVQASACSQAQACGGSLGCQTYYRCERACSTLDCTAACAIGDDAGYALFEGYGQLLLGSCPVACALGQNWTCVGHVSWPAPRQTANSIQAVAADVLSNTPSANATVQLCGADDQGCVQPIAQTTTDTSGAFTLDYTLTNTLQGGQGGYLLITSSAIAPALFFWGFPLSEPVAQFGIKISTVSASEMPAFFGALATSQVPGHGLAFIGILDCAKNPAVGVHVTVLSGSDASTQTYYGAGVGFSKTATSTSASGVALIVNLPVGPVSIQVATADGVVVSQQSFLVNDGAAEEVVALPTPTNP